MEYEEYAKTSSNRCSWTDQEWDGEIHPGNSMCHQDTRNFEDYSPWNYPRTKEDYPSHELSPSYHCWPKFMEWTAAGAK